MKELGAFAVLFVILAISDYVSYKSKAIISMLFTSAVLLLVGLWLGLVPKTIFSDSGLLAVAGTLTALNIVHMGTLMSVREFIKQWKTVLVAVAAVIGITIFVFLIGQFVIGRQYALAAAPPIAGGVVAGIIMNDAAKAAAAPEIGIFAVLLVVLQGFIGYPVASLCLKKEAKRLAGGFKPGTADAEGSAEERKSKIRFIPALPKDIQTSNVLIAKLALVTLLSFWIAGLTKGAINKYIVCLVFGVVFCEIGFLETNILTKANSFGLAMAGIIVMAFSALVNASAQTVLSLLWPIVASLVLGVIGIGVACMPVGKLLGLSWEMSIAIGSTALFGFPGTYILSDEVSRSCSGSDAEKKYIMDQIFPKMLIGGFVTVTICSVILAGILAKVF